MKFIPILTLIGCCASVTTHDKATLVLTLTLEDYLCPESDPNCSHVWRIKKLSFTNSSGQDLENCPNEGPGTLSAELKYALMENWADLTVKNIDNEIRRRWEKDGSCVTARLEALKTPENYFVLGSELMKNYSLENVMPVGSSMGNVSEIESNIKKRFRVQPRIVCSEEKDKPQRLVGVKLCFSNSAKLIHCPRYIDSTCKKRGGVVVPRLHRRNRNRNQLSSGIDKHSDVLVFEESFPETECHEFGRNCGLNGEEQKIKSLKIYNQQGNPLSDCEPKKDNQFGVVYDEALMKLWLFKNLKNTKLQLENAFSKDGSCVVKFMHAVQDIGDFILLGVELLRKYNMSEIMASIPEKLEIRKYHVVGAIQEALRVRPVVECSVRPDGFQYFSSVKLCFNAKQKLIHCPKSIESSCTGNSYKWQPELPHKLGVKSNHRVTLVLTQVLEEGNCSMEDIECQSKPLVWKIGTLGLVNSNGDDLVNCSTGPLQGHIFTAVTLRNIMLENWVGLTTTNIDGEMRKHWEKDGACVERKLETIQNPNDYFLWSLELMRKFSMENVLSINSTIVNTSSIEDNIKKVLKVHPRFVCDGDKGEFRRLEAVKLCFNENGKLIHCPRHVLSTCGKGNIVVRNATTSKLPSVVVKNKGNFVVLSMAITGNLCLENRSSSWCNYLQSIVVDNFRAVSYETQKPLTMCYVKYDYYGYEHADKDPVTALLTKSWREYGSCIKDVISFINNFEEYHKNANQLFYRYIGAQESIDRMTADRMKVFFHKKNIEPTFRCSRDGNNNVNYVDLCFNQQLRIMKCPNFMRTECP